MVFVEEKCHDPIEAVTAPYCHLLISILRNRPPRSEEHEASRIGEGRHNGMRCTCLPQFLCEIQYADVDSELVGVLLCEI